MNANANFLLNTRAGQDDSVILWVIDTASRINFIGASCPASVKPITHGLTSLTVAPPKDKRSILAIQVWHKPVGQDEPCRDLCYLLTAWYDSEPRVELDKPFIPPADRSAQLMDCGLLVRAGDQDFVAPNFCWEQAEGLAEMKAIWADQNIRIVNNPNLLCRFLAGEATIEQVEAAARDAQAASDLRAKYAGLLSLNLSLEKAMNILAVQEQTTVDCARIVLTRALELQEIAEAIIGIAQTAKFGNRRKVLEKIAGYKEITQTSRLYLADLQKALPPEKNGG